MKDCPSDWPKTKCPKELCFQIGSQADDRDEGTCWRCKAAEAGIPTEHRESLRPGIDSADVERFILTPEERRSQMEEDGFCWFCGHRCGCESCEPAKGEDRSLLGKNRPPPAVEERKPVNKRLKLERIGSARPKSASPSSKSKSKARPQSRSVSKQISRGFYYSQSPPPDDLVQRTFSPSEERMHAQILETKQEYAGYGDQSHFFGPEAAGMYSLSTTMPSAGHTKPGYSEQLNLLDPRLFEQPFSSVPEPTHQPLGNPLMIDPQLTDSHVASAKAEQHQTQAFEMRQFDLYGTSPPSAHVYQQRYGQPQAHDQQIIGDSQANLSAPPQDSQWYGQSQVLNPELSKGNDAYPNTSQSYGQPQAFDAALCDINQVSPSFPGHAYEQNYQQSPMNYPFHGESNQLRYGHSYVSSILSLLLCYQTKS